MKIEISLFGTIVILFVLHTILTHLFNWLYRKTMYGRYGALPIVCVFIYIYEIIFVIAFLNFLIK